MTDRLRFLFMLAAARDHKEGQWEPPDNESDPRLRPYLRMVERDLADYLHANGFTREVLEGPMDCEIIQCGTCPKLLWWRDSYAKGDVMMCAECDTEVYKRKHPPTLDFRLFLPPPINE